MTANLFIKELKSVTVTVNPSQQPNSRWYSGAGIYRSVELVHTPKLHIVEDGDSEVVALRSTTIQVEKGSSGTARVAVTVELPRLWSAEHPNLYLGRRMRWKEDMQKEYFR